MPKIRFRGIDALLISTDSILTGVVMTSNGVNYCKKIQYNNTLEILNRSVNLHILGSERSLLLPFIFLTKMANYPKAKPYSAFSGKSCLLKYLTMFFCL